VTSALREIGYQASSVYIAVVKAILVGTRMHRDVPDRWTGTQWRALTEHSMGRHVKHPLAVVAVRAYGVPMGTFLSAASSLSRSRTALSRQFVGRDAVQRETNIAVQRLRTMGYAMKSRTCFIESCVACLLAAAEKQRLIDISEEDFNRFISQPMSGLMRKGTVSLSAALYDMAVVTRRYTRTRVDNRGPQLVEPQVDAEWLAWKTRWRAMSLLSERTKVGITSDIMIAGRWLKRFHPDVRAPQQWSFDLAAEYVRFVDQMKVGELLERKRSTKYVLVKSAYTHTSFAAVRSPPASPVLVTPRGSTSNAWHSEAARVRCSVPFLITYISPASN
jgi:hypothetical protein